MNFNSSFGSKQVVAFRFEPFLLHVECRNVETAQALSAVAWQTGLRLTGISPGKHHTIVSIRSTMIMEAPVWMDGKTLISCEYLENLLNIANEKFATNTIHMSKFYKAVENMFATPSFNKKTTGPREKRPFEGVVPVKEKIAVETGLDIDVFETDMFSTPSDTINENS
eukprot:TRINITY_DN6751_c0_g1_i2.p1 TRINITY_DN6751_c0_g1~~TRINITY_DN6751_c0_g1_i2.p1  ORF type:complete len:168 (-),score=42.33 TRINITY_DN6751_c0_g1_i2:8-511(-)